MNEQKWIWNYEEKNMIKQWGEQLNKSEMIGQKMECKKWGENDHTFIQRVFESNFAWDFFPTSNERSNMK